MGALIVLRIVHISFGVFWAGGAMFMNFIIGPAIGAAGPEGFRVMQEMSKRRFHHALLGSALLTILSGIDLLRRDSGNFSAGWFHSPMGIGLSTGMVAAIISFLIALLAVTPTMKRMGALAAQMAQAAPEARAGLMDQVTATRARLVAFGVVATLFVVIAVLAMATARYL